MPSKTDLRQAADSFLEAALVGSGWELALHRMARVLGARGGNIIASLPDRSVGGYASPDVAAAQSGYYTAARPPDTRFLRVRTGPHCGFRADFDDLSPEEIAGDPYYQEFLRPEGLKWHATAWLAQLGDVSVEISLKRTPSERPFCSSEIKALDGVLPDLRRSVVVAKCLLDAEAKGIAGTLEPRGVATYEINAQGSVLRLVSTAGATDLPIAVRRGHLFARDERQQKAVDRLLSRIVDQHASYAVSLDSGWQLLGVRVAGAARDVFNAARAVLVLIPGPGRRTVRNGRLQLAQEAFGLTERETEVAALIAGGTRVADVARTLAIGQGTVRNHVKSLYAKTGTSCLVELVALLSRLQM